MNGITNLEGEKISNEYASSNNFDGNIVATSRAGILEILLPKAKSGVTGGQYYTIGTIADPGLRPSKTMYTTVYDTRNLTWVYYAVETTGECKFYSYLSGNLTYDTNTANTKIIGIK